MSSRPLRIGLAVADNGLPRELVDQVLRCPKLLVQAIYHPRWNLCRKLAEQHEAVACPSLQTFLHKSEAAVVIEPNWMGSLFVRECLLAGKPVLTFPTATAALRDTDLEDIQKVCRDRSAMFVPGLSERWSRSTLRLRELTATNLGAIEHLVIKRSFLEWNEQFIPWLDWCGYVVQSAVESVELTREGICQLFFRRRTSTGEPVTANLERPSHDNLETIEVQCRHGRVTISGVDHLQWQTDRQPVSEDLSLDRNVIAVMLDLFGRRVVGGLVPVPDAGDLLQAHRLLAALLQSQREARRVEMKIH
ncbi:MAG: hypothetical protein KDA80_06060 [Planctomycetaceae bacterium]|nr:hypothetical protein [Planctomycetaceae bacterium]